MSNPGLIWQAEVWTFPNKCTILQGHNHMAAIPTTVVLHMPPSVAIWGLRPGRTAPEQSTQVAWPSEMRELRDHPPMRSRTRDVQIIEMQAACSRNRAKSGRDRPNLAEVGSNLADMGLSWSKPPNFGPSVPKVGTSSAKIDQLGTKSTKVGPASTEFGR